MDLEFNEEGPFKLSVNYEGHDYEIQVQDLSTANLVLNDSVVAFKIVTEQHPEILGHTIVEQHSEIIGADLENVAGCSKSAECSENQKGPAVWTQRKPTEIDIGATDALLDLRAKNANLFDDTKTNKTKLWTKIAQEMGVTYNLGVNPAEKCRQKFVNLTKAYINYIKHQNKTGVGKEEEPPYFEKIHSIMGQKHKIQPATLDDSFSEISSEETLETGKEKENNATDRFKNVKKKIKPMNATEKVLSELKEDREDRKVFLSTLESHFKKTEEHRERYLNILEKAFDGKKKKRTRMDSDSD